MIGDGSFVNGTIADCENRGRITGEPSVEYVLNNNEDLNAASIGGIVGNANTDHCCFIVENCSNSGNVSGVRNIGGIAGVWTSDGIESENNGIKNCENSGSVTATSFSYTDAAGINVIQTSEIAGGIVGQFVPYRNACGTIQKCSNNGNVSAAKNAGGIAGWIYADLLSNATIIDCTSSGAVEGHSEIGGIVGSTSTKGNGIVTLFG
ncbi:MAG: hypothetical protein IJB22_01475, partial [Clostridia bacterium]|nr:hypothetical protein [Clostridia bacterium]